MTAVYVKQFIWQRCIGYSADFKKTYCEQLVEYSDGSQRVMYKTHTRRDNGLTDIGELYSTPPQVDVPIPASH